MTGAKLVQHSLADQISRISLPTLRAGVPVITQPKRAAGTRAPFDVWRFAQMSMSLSVLPVELVVMLSLPFVALAAPVFILQANAAVVQSFGNIFLPTSYSTVNGSFAQDDPATNAATFDVYANNASLGLNGGNWAKFTSYVGDLNRNADANTSYKVIFIARHGEGMWILPGLGSRSLKQARLP